MTRLTMDATDSKPVPRTGARLRPRLSQGDSRRPDKVAARFGALSGRTVDGAHQFLLRLKDEMAWAARAFVECGAMDRWTRFRRPMEEIEDTQSVPLLAAAHLAEEIADGAEDVAFVRFQADPTEANRRACIRAILHHETTLRTLARAIARDGGLNL
jgi:hypothetical protein